MTQKGSHATLGVDESIFLVGEATIDRMPGLSPIFEKMGASFARFLGRYADGVSAFVGAFEACRVHELALQSEDIGKFYVFRCLGADFRVAVGVDSVSRSLLFELLLGSGVVESAQDRPLTRIEDRVIAFALLKLMSDFAEAFGPLAELTFERDFILEESGVFALGARAAVVAHVRLTLRHRDLAGNLLFALPRTGLDPFRSELARAPGAEGKATDEKWSENLYNNIVQTEVKAEVRIEARGFTLGDLAGLEVGDILRLPIAPTSPIRVVSEGRTIFWCTLGQKDGMYTVRLEALSDERESYIENILGV